MSDRIRILIVNAPEEINGVTMWREYAPLKLLRDVYGNEIEIIFNETGRVFDHHLLFADVVMAFRPCNPEHPSVLARAKELGCKVIVDFDDDLLNVPIGFSFYKELFNRSAYVLESLALADVVWLSTENLKSVYETALVNFTNQVKRQNGGAMPEIYGSAPVMKVIPNAILHEELPEKPNGNTRIAIWRGADFHRDDLEAYRIQYEQILRNVDYFQWVGYMPTWGEVKNSRARIDFNPGVQADKWFSYLQKLKPSLIWKPLVNNQFNDSKSNISWIEATVAGGICLSNFSGHSEQWTCAVKELPKIEESYSVFWRQSAEKVKKEYDLRAWNEVRYKSILQLVNG